MGRTSQDLADHATAEAKPLRSDARRSLDALLQAAKDVFETSGVDAPVREIAARANFGVGTVYRQFPSRAAASTLVRQAVGVPVRAVAW